jgi:isoleucyl-tRNA synthetase
VFRQATIKHPYPYCWRSGTPLIYKTTPSWYVKSEELRDRMVQANAAVHWVPDFVDEARFRNWLKDARDWSISRSRFWGTPIPVWHSDDGDVHCVGSVAELEQLTGQPVADLHPHRIDHLTFTKDGKVFRRVKDVFDCWFESGAMPWAQMHYPFENKEIFEGAFPAQFIAEGLDQTRGWFYTLVVLGTALFGQSPFKNVVVNGLVLAKGHYKNKDEYVPHEHVEERGGKAFDRRDGAELKVVTEKMSKSKKNYTAPESVIDTFGADALRAYLINSPVVRAEPLRFEDEGVREVVRTVLLPLHNALSFFVSYANVDGWDPKEGLAAAPPLAERPELDRWIVSVQQSLIAEINTQMEGYYLYKVVPPMLAFIDDLTNWYIRRSRRRFWKNADTEAARRDKAAAYATLYTVLTTFSRVLAPVMPFSAESMYQRLVREPGVAGAADSVHLCDYPVVDAACIDRDVEAAMGAVRRVIVLGRALREKHKLKTRQPLARVTVVTHDERLRTLLAAQKALIVDELNVKDLVVVKDDASLASLSFKANFKTLGKRVGGKMKAVAAAVEQLDRAAWATLDGGGALTIEGESLTREDVLVTRTASGDVVLETEGELTVALETALTPALLDEGLVREVTSRLQQARKDAGCALTDRVELTLTTMDARLKGVIAAAAAEIADEVLATQIVIDVPAAPPTVGEPVEVNGLPLWIELKTAA